MMALIFLQLILMFFFAISWIPGNGSQNWFDGWRDRQAIIQENVAGGRTENKPEKCGMTLTAVEVQRIATISEGSQIPVATNTPASNSLSLKY